MDSRPFCVPCGVRYHCEKNEVAIRYGSVEDRPNDPKLWDAVLCGDLWQCPNCGQRIIVGWALKPWYPQDEAEAIRVLRILEAMGARTFIPLDAVRVSPLSS